MLAEACFAPIFLTIKPRREKSKRGKEKAAKTENTTVKAKHIPTLK